LTKIFAKASVENITCYSIYYTVPGTVCIFQIIYSSIPGQCLLSWQWAIYNPFSGGVPTVRTIQEFQVE